ncbi:phage holin family protein [Thermoflavimicrobium daqui]|jgi:putative membrane protein|uniref:Phage holin family protein n=1 Tax=Thermoflavimicrobium daqui TaxID=2137476 RepID=A0A364K570_9BACL|nr:phage holin family protein [Thermoflavimicrobium daqui]RAL24515.1 hypothetical protein DL897_09405 [Thermoflavimicrobium daqui]
MNGLIRLLLKVAIISLTVFLVADWLDGIRIGNIGAAIFMAILLGLINAWIRPLIMPFTLPVNTVSLGVYILIINAIMFTLFAITSGIVDDEWFRGITIDGMIPALTITFFVSLVSWLLTLLFDRK